MKLQIDELGFVGINVEDWDINRSYRKPTITTDYNTWITYITRKNVPAGIPLTDNEYWKPILKESGLENITRRLYELERKVAYYHPEGVTVNVSPQTVYVGQRKQISITASLTVPANRITLYRNNDAIYQVEDSASLEYQDIVVPATTDNIVYRVVAVIGSETKANEAIVSVEEDAVDSITWTGYSISPSTVPVGLAATFITGTVMAVYKSGRQEDVTSSAVFNAHRGSIADHTYIAPSTAGEDTIRASYSGKIADSILTVTVINGQLLTVQVGHGANYATALFTDTFETLSNNMHVSIDRNAGDYIFIKVDKHDTVNNLYIYNEGGGIFEYIEIALSTPVIDGNYKYYQSANRYNAGTAIPYVINKV